MAVFYSVQGAQSNQGGEQYYVPADKLGREQLQAVFAQRQAQSIVLDAEQVLRIEFGEPSQQALRLDRRLEEQADADTNGVRCPDPVGTASGTGSYFDTEQQGLTKHHFLVRSFTKLDQQALLYVLKYRNSDAIRQHMVTTTPLKEADHLQFCANLKNRPDRLYMLNCLDYCPTSVASINANSTWNNLLDYGMYAVGTAHPERSAAQEHRIPVYEIDRAVIAHMVLSRGVLEVNFQFKQSNPKSIHVNLHKHGALVTKEDAEFVHTKLECHQPAAFYLQQLAYFCSKYHCDLEFDL